MSGVASWAEGAVRRRSWRAGATVVTGSIVLGYLAAMATGFGSFDAGDASIYVRAARDYMAGGSIYAATNEGGFGFTYPPFAALVVSSLAWLPGAIPQRILQLAGMAACWGLSALTLRDLGWAARTARWGALALTGPFLLLYPVLRCVESGQVDLVLALLVAVDLLVLRDSRWGGTLVGLAGALKLTPAAFALYFLLTRRWAALGRSVASFALATAVAHLVAPADSAAYWTRSVWDTSKVGSQAAALNQSWSAVVARLQSPPGDLVNGNARFVWLGLVVLTLVAGSALVLRLSRLRSQSPALAALAGIVLLISPISWLNHWSVVVVLLTMALGTGHWPSSRRRLLLAAAGVVVLSVPPWWYLGSARGWSPVQAALGSLTVAWLVCFLASLWTMKEPPGLSPGPP